MRSCRFGLPRCSLQVSNPRQWFLSLKSNEIIFVSGHRPRRPRWPVVLLTLAAELNSGFGHVPEPATPPTTGTLAEKFYAPHFATIMIRCRGLLQSDSFTAGCYRDS